MTSGSLPVSVAQTTGRRVSVTGRAVPFGVGTPQTIGDHAVLVVLPDGEGPADEEGEQGREEQPAGQHQQEHRISTLPVEMASSAGSVDDGRSVTDPWGALRSCGVAGGPRPGAAPAGGVDDLPEGGDQTGHRRKPRCGAIPVIRTPVT